MRNNAKSRSYADKRSRECNMKTSSRVFRIVANIVTGLIGIPLNVVFKFCLSRNRSVVSISAGNPEKQK